MAKARGRRAAAAVDSLAERIRSAIAARGLSAYAVAKASATAPQVLQRFVRRERDLTLETASRVCAALGLKLIDSYRPRATKAARGGLHDIAGDDAESS